MFKKKRKIRNYSTVYKQPSNSGAFKKRHSSLRSSKRIRPIFRKIKTATSATIILALLSLLFYSAFFSNYFLITAVQVSEENPENQALSEQIQSALPKVIGQNLLFADLHEIENQVLSHFPEIQNVKFKKDYPHTLIVEFEQYPLVANVIHETPTLKKSYILNSIGYAVKENLESTNLPYILIKSDEPLNSLTYVIEKNKLNYILDAKTYFEEKFGMRIIETKYKRNPREVHFLTEKDFSIWLDIQRPFEDQFKKLKKSLVKLDIYNDPLTYIDLRIAGNNGDKIIYKRK